MKCNDKGKIANSVITVISIENIKKPKKVQN